MQNHQTLQVKRDTRNKGRQAAAMLLALLMLVGCSTVPAALSPTVASPQPARELHVYGWAGYMPQSILSAFSAEYNIKVTFDAYDSQEAAIEQMRVGNTYDVVVMGNDFIPKLIADGMLAELNYSNIPNFKNISANFRDLSYDPGNKHSFLIQWGTTGLLARTDLTSHPITRWADLWDPALRGKVGLWSLQRYLIGIALKSQGYSANSEDRAELEVALQQLLKLNEHAFYLDPNHPSSAPYLLDGSATLVYGWALDIREARKASRSISYILPEEGSILFGDNVVIPANSANKDTAELFLNFLLRPEISAQMTNETATATPNEAARPFIRPEILNDPVIFPPNADLAKAELILPLSAAGQQLNDEIWQRFLAEEGSQP